MPMPSEDRYFGGKPSSAHKAYDAMMTQYGKEKGEQVYHATVNKHKRKHKGNPFLIRK